MCCSYSSLSSIVEEAIRAYFESRLALLEPVFPLACHRLCEGPDFSLEFGFKAQPLTEGNQLRFILINPFFKNTCSFLTALVCHWQVLIVGGFSLIKYFQPHWPSISLHSGTGIILFIFHANFMSEITARLCGPCSVHAVVLNDKFQLPIFLVCHDTKRQCFIFFKQMQSLCEIHSAIFNPCKLYYVCWICIFFYCNKTQIKNTGYCHLFTFHHSFTICVEI